MKPLYTVLIITLATTAKMALFKAAYWNNFSILLGSVLGEMILVLAIPSLVCVVFWAINKSFPSKAFWYSSIGLFVVLNFLMAYGS
jgi:hypothetical protein